MITTKANTEEDNPTFHWFPAFGDFVSPFFGILVYTSEHPEDSNRSPTEIPVTTLKVDSTRPTVAKEFLTLFIISIDKYLKILVQ